MILYLYVFLIAGVQYHPFDIISDRDISAAVSMAGIDCLPYGPKASHRSSLQELLSEGNGGRTAPENSSDQLYFVSSRNYCPLWGHLR